MGLFSSVVDVFTGGAASAKDGAKAAQKISEARFREGVDAINTGTDEALNTIRGTQELLDYSTNYGRSRSLEELRRGSEASRGQAVGGAQERINAINSALGTARGEFREGAAGASGYLQPFSSAGGQSFDMAAALSGALGRDAQSNAFRNFQDSPGQQFLRDRGEQAILRNSAATGGLGGGNVLKALQEHGIGLANQSFQQNLNNLLNIGQSGQAAATNQSGIQERLGQTLGNASLNQGQNVSNILRDRINQVIGIETGLGRDIANVETQAEAALRAGRMANANNLASLQVGRGTNIANLAAEQGSQQAKLEQNLGDARGATNSGLGLSLASLLF